MEMEEYPEQIAEKTVDSRAPVTESVVAEKVPQHIPDEAEISLPGKEGTIESHLQIAETSVHPTAPSQLEGIREELLREIADHERSTHISSSSVTTTRSQKGPLSFLGPLTRKVTSPIKRITHTCRQIVNGDMVRRTLLTYMDEDLKDGKRQGTGRVLSEQDIIIISRKLNEGAYSKILSNSLKDTIFGALAWPISWGAIAALCVYAPPLGIPLALYEAIPGLGGMTSLAEILWLYHRVIPMVVNRVRQRRFLSSSIYLTLPLLAFGDINWMIAPLAVNSATEPELLQLMGWSLHREVGFAFNKLRTFFRNSFGIPKTLWRKVHPSTEVHRSTLENIAVRRTTQSVEQTLYLSQLEEIAKTCPDAIQTPTLASRSELRAFEQRGGRFITFGAHNGQTRVIAIGDPRKGMFEWINGNYFKGALFISGITPNIATDGNFGALLRAEVLRMGLCAVAFDAPASIAERMATDLRSSMNARSATRIERQEYVVLTSREKDPFNPNLEAHFDVALPHGIHAEQVMTMYRQVFGPTVQGSPCLQAFSDKEIRNVLADKDFHKLIVTTGEKIIGFLSLTSNINKIPWIRQDGFLSAVSRIGLDPKKAMYIPCVAISIKAGLLLPKIAQAVFDFTMNNGFDYVGFDCSSNGNVRLPTVLKFAVRKRNPELFLIGSQDYYQLLV